MELKGIIYLDNSATTRAFEETVAAVGKYMREEYYNASALYGNAVAVDEAITGARKRLVSALRGNGSIVYTSGGTESNNIAILGALTAMRPGKKRIVTTEIEHPSVLAVFNELRDRGNEVIYLRPCKDGSIDPQQVEEALTEDTALVSIMHVNNETGAVQDLPEIGKAIRKKSPTALFHSDGVQSFLKVPVFAESAGIDLYSISAHKFHGPKGIGALYIKKGVKLDAIHFGGGQEGGLRPGTYNSPGVMGLDAALKKYMTNQEDYLYTMRQCKEAMASAFKMKMEGAFINGPKATSGSPHILNVSFIGVPGQVLLQALEEQGIIIGTGSACSSKKGKESKVLAAMGLPKERTESAIRISLSPEITLEQAKFAASVMLDTVKKLRYWRKKDE